MKKILYLSLLFLIGGIAALLTGCASIVDGAQQQICVDTPPVKGATCCLKNDKGTWYLNCTPGTVTVHRSYNDLYIVAQKPGYADTTVKVASKVKGMAFGNILFGGCIGAGVDCATGSAYDYPSNVVIPMKPLARNRYNN